MDSKYFCRKCKGQRNHKSIFEKENRGGSDRDQFYWTEKYNVIECLGCETISFLEIYGDSEMIDYDEDGNQEYTSKVIHYPSYIEGGNELINDYYLPTKIRNIYIETISAFRANSFILTAGGFRAIIEALCNHLEIRKDDLSKRIDLLHKKGFLTLNESKRLHSIRFLGNDALHEMEIPKKEQLLILLGIVNHLLENLFVHDAIINGKVDLPIDDYKVFLNIVRNNVSKIEVQSEVTLTQILGKSKKLVNGEDFKNFEKQLIHQISKDKTIDYLSVIEAENRIIFKVEKMPEFIIEF